MSQAEAEDGRRLSALILEDAEPDARALVEELEAGGFQVTYRRVDSRETFAEALPDTRWDIVLAGDTLRLSALEALSLVRQNRPDLPLLLVSRSAREEDSQKALDAGAHDFVLKDHLTRLLPAVERAVRAKEDRRTREQSEEALRESEERYRELVENANDVVLRVNLQGNFTSMNRAGELISGYTREELTRMNMHQVLTPESFQRAQQMIVQKLADNRPTIYELEMIARDGHHVPLELSTRLIYHDGVPTGIQGIA